MINRQEQPILVVDDQAAICYSMKRFLEKEGYAIETATSAAEALARIRDCPPFLAFVDVRMPEVDGLQLLGKIKRVHPAVEVIMMTAYSTTDQAIEAMKLGAFDYLIKPFENSDLLALIDKAAQQQLLNNSLVIADSGDERNEETEHFIGRSPAMLEIFKQIGKVAASNAPVLILGESGTGKELVARAIFQHSKRRQARFLAINCAAIPEQLLESELFGYEKGAFTSADSRRIGKIEQCRGGTLFLDEIGDLPPATQAKLLRLLQDGSFQRLGGDTPMSADFRLISATNQLLDRLMTEKRFREDLFFRINTVTITVPPLRARQEDIPLLADYFLQQYCARLDKKIICIPEATRQALCRHSWPGNVRELENVIHKAVLMSSGPCLELADSLTSPVQPQETNSDAVSTEIEHLVQSAFASHVVPHLQDLTTRLQTLMVSQALARTGHNQVRAARMLGISRNTLRKLMPPN